MIGAVADATPASIDEVTVSKTRLSTLASADEVRVRVHALDAAGPGEGVTGVEAMPPIGPSEEMVMVGPVSSSRVALPPRAASLRRSTSFASCHTLMPSALRMTGTIRPPSVWVATPMCTAPWRVTTLAASS